MAMAVLCSQRSKDPNTQVGCCIVSKDKKIVAMGYNGLPWGCSDDEYPWDRTNEDPLETKYLYVCHSEMNAILNKNTENLKNSTLYCTMHPCNECTKMIIQSGIVEIVYMHNPYEKDTLYQASKRMLQSAKVNVRQYTLRKKTINIDL